MTTLRLDIRFNSNCVLSVDDITGFNINTGFIAENATATQEGQYKLSDGYFINIIQYHKYNSDPVYTNKTDTYTYISSASVNPTYASNFTTKNYDLATDGVYTFKRLFVISRAYYLANQGDITRTPIYYDSAEGKFYKVVSSVTTEIAIDDLPDSLSSTTTGSVVTYKFVSTCNLNRCLYLLQKELLVNGLGTCNSSKSLYDKERDFVANTLSVIKYLKEDGYFTEIQRIIESSNCCGLICRTISKKNNEDCGCG